MAALCVAAMAPNIARAETATFSEPAAMSDADRTALSTQGDNSGYLLALGERLGLVFNAPLQLNQGDRISVFSLPPQTGNARAQIRFGSYNDGSPIILASRNFRAGATGNIRVSNGLLSGCQLLGGCDYIEIITTRTRRGAGGVEIDYITVDGQVVEVASPSPEPTTWALMIVAFAGIAARLKVVRNERTRPRRISASRTGWRSRLWQAITAPRTVRP